VLVFWLDHAQRRDARDEGLEQMLGDALRLHGQYLSAEEGFDGGSNVGVLEAIALRDMARRNHSKDGLELATRRLLSTLAVIVSPSGTTLEHSAHYHFIVLAWLEAALASEPDGRATASIRAYVEKMRRAGYFLLDSTDRVVQIGDSDSTVVPDFSRRLSDDLGEPGVVFFDSLAGFAAFKPARSSTDGRYVLYRIQRAPIALPAHCHADAMSLVVVWNGETILGDSGRYTYDGSGNYFASHPAHNSIFPQQLLFPTAMRVMSSVVRADHRRTGEGVFFRAEMDWHGARTARGLSIPSAAQTIVVNDTLRSDASSGVASRFCWTWNAGNDVRHVKLQSIGPDSAVWTVETHRRQRFEFRMTVSGTDSPMEAELLRGASRPELGWSSPTYGVKRPSWVVLARIRPGPMVTVRTVLERIR
jgi:hypothetical protein